MKIYVGKLSQDITEDDLKEAFKAFGQLTSVNVIEDKYTGNSRGFGFVEMLSNKEGQAAIDGLNGKELKGQIIVVNEARSRTEKRGGGGRRY
jgi:cold-inducible RNA-binding protein